MQKLRRELEKTVISHPSVLQHALSPGTKASQNGNSAKTINLDSSKRLIRKDVDFWRDLGYYGQHPNHRNDKNNFLSDKAIKKMAKKTESLGNVTENYQLVVNSNPSKHIMLLQYPTRDNDQYYTKEQKPLELRIKPKSGKVEVDIPLKAEDHYSKERGRLYGSALRTSGTLPRGDTTFAGPPTASHGLITEDLGERDAEMVDAASEPDELSDAQIGFHSDASNTARHRPPRLKSAYQAEHDRPDEGQTFSNGARNLSFAGEDSDQSVEEESFMSKFTLEGRIRPLQEGDPLYAIATFGEGMGAPLV